MDRSAAETDVCTTVESGWNASAAEMGDNGMPISVLTLELAIEHAQSLKDRRQVVRSIKDKLRNSFNISVAEMDDALLWNRATLGVAAISNSTAYLAGQLQEVETAAQRICVGLGCEILDSFVETGISLGD
jgi:uncharacterized protein YlxP (DUF503 family)